jgi:hypothetical protein
MAKDILNKILDKILENIPNKIPKNIPEHILENMSERIPGCGFLSGMYIRLCTGRYQDTLVEILFIRILLIILVNISYFRVRRSGILLSVGKIP